MTKPPDEILGWIRCTKDGKSFEAVLFDDWNSYFWKVEGNLDLAEELNQNASPLTGWGTLPEGPGQTWFWLGQNWLKKNGYRMLKSMPPPEPDPLPPFTVS